MEPTYFTCTLGQAASLGIQQPHKTINEFVDAQAKESPDRPAVAFPHPTGKDVKGEWIHDMYSFSLIRHGSLNVARTLLSAHEGLLSKRTTIGLLCPSTPEFLFTWLALMRLGHAVLLIAPQCQPAAIRALCGQCEVDLLLHDEVYGDQAQEAASLKEEKKLTAKCLDFDTPRKLDENSSQRLASLSPPSPAVAQDDVAYLHHTSGTSSGMPKPIPQPHRAAVGVLPSFESGKANATFTTTPLYHGGIADLLRAWASGGLIWLFPGKGIPITATNVVKCLNVAAAVSDEDASMPSVTYFSSVPYVLQMLEADPAGLKYLQSMQIVGVGGAALPPEIGDRMVNKGVNLISRFGSAECGFLLSSHRPYDKDNEWQYLRLAPDSAFVQFEPRDEVLSELVVLKGWPHMAKRNREDGSYATSDLFEPHPAIKGAWKYHSRADSQLTLITGKKFDPAPLEAAIATSDMVEDALIFGNGQPYPGVLVFRSEKAAPMKDADFGRQIWANIEKLNNESQDHARISKSMLVLMSVLSQPLEKSSKGTIIRGATEKRFRDEIEGAYGQVEGTDQSSIPDTELVNAVKSIITIVAPHKTNLKDETDLFAYGIDSVAGMQIRSRLRQLLPFDKRDLPITVVEDYGTVSGLADYVRKRRHGETVAGKDSNEEDELMRQLVDEYSNFPQSERDLEKEGGGANGKREEDDDSDVVVLTGATGALGAHVLDQYRSLDSVRKVYCLVRGADAHAAKERVAKALEQRKLRALEDDVDDKVVVLTARLADSDLGLDEQTYAMLAREATVIMHVAWSVNFRMKLRSFVKDSIAGLSHLISLALAAPTYRPTPRIVFCSSVASVMAHPSSPIPEELVDDPSFATELGYSRSKWVAEQICARVNKLSRLQGRITIYRVGQLAGDTKTGVWNAKEAWPLMLSSVKETGVLPDLEDEVLDWLPVNTAAAALIEGASYTPRDGEEEDVQVYHVVNSHATPKWSDLLSWLGKRQPFETVSPSTWVAKLDALAEKGSQHPALQLLDLWKRAYAGRETDVGGTAEGADGTPRDRKVFGVQRSQERIPVLRTVEPLSEAYCMRLWEWIVEESL